MACCFSVEAEPGFDLLSVCGDLTQDRGFEGTVGTPISMKDQGMDMSKGRSERKERG